MFGQLPPAFRQNDNGWNQGLLFLSPSQVWAQPPYYVTQMDSRTTCRGALRRRPIARTVARCYSNELDDAVRTLPDNFRWSTCKTGRSRTGIVLDGFHLVVACGPRRRTQAAASTMSTHPRPRWRIYR